eukprot:10514023-Alexandrium_andersonii.AAC.1
MAKPSEGETIDHGGAEFQLGPGQTPAVAIGSGRSSKALEETRKRAASDCQRRHGLMSAGVYWRCGVAYRTAA